MTEGKQKKEEDEVTEEQLDEVSGGLTADRTIEEMSLTKQMDQASVDLAQFAIEGNAPGTVEINFVHTDDDEDD